ncbi:hypothetical protein N7454_005331 [Penicillium verhagenii]|nr:hypothetical protein N7454_005331 [Penicillium verhagenii]
MHSGSNRDYYYPDERDSYHDSRDPRDTRYLRDPRDSRDPLALSDHHNHGHSHSDHRSRSSHSHGDHKSKHHKKSSRDRDPHHDLHLAEGAVVAAAVAEAIHQRRKKGGEDVSSGFGHIARTVGAGALGAVAANELERARDSHRNKSPRESGGHHRHHGHNHDQDHGYYRR